MGFISKLDSFYINLTAVRVFTDMEYELFLRECGKLYAENASKLKTEKKNLAKTMAGPTTSSKLVDPDGGAPPLEPDDPYEAVDEADAGRNLS